jgi:hypothetical protein
MSLYNIIYARISRNVRGDVTRMRVLINASYLKYNYFVVTVHTIFDKTGYIYETEDDEFEMDDNPLLKDKIFYSKKGSLFVWPIPFYLNIENDEDALSWAKKSMRGHSEFPILFDYKENKIIKNIDVDYFCSGIFAFKKLDELKLLPDVLKQSYKHKNRDLNHKLLNVGPDGICVIVNDSDFNYNRNYNISELISSDYCVYSNTSKLISSDKISDKLLFGYDNLDDEIKLITYLSDIDEVWDLETSSQFNVSFCATQEDWNQRIRYKSDLFIEIKDILSIDESNLTDNHMNIHNNIFEDEAIFDKYVRTVEGDKYKLSWKLWQEKIGNTIITFLLSDEVGTNMPLVLAKLIKEYIEPLHVTRDMLRKHKVHRWIKNLSLIPCISKE